MAFVEVSLLLPLPPPPVASPLALQPRLKQRMKGREVRAKATFCIDRSSGKVTRKV
jgi:hypothetical protein